MLQTLEKTGKITKKGFTEMYKNETLIGITKIDFGNALFFVIFVKTVEGYRVKSLS